LVVLSVSVRFAPLMTAPEGSFTIPTTVPVLPDWAAQGLALKTIYIENTSSAIAKYAC